MQNEKEQRSGVNGIGSPDADVSDSELRKIVKSALANVTRGTRVLAVISDKTRDDNTNILFPAAAEILSRNGVSRFDALVAQGTHGPMTDSEKFAKIGAAEHFSGTIFDHKWDDREALVTIGELSSETVYRITDGLLDEAIRLTINRLLAPDVYDLILDFRCDCPARGRGVRRRSKIFFPGCRGC